MKDTAETDKDGLLLELEKLRRRNRELAEETARLKESEAALMAREQRHRVLSEAAFEAIFLSEKGVCIGQNRAAEHMFGFTEREALGRMGTEWIAPEYRDRVLNFMLTGSGAVYEAVALRKDGTTFPCEIRPKMINLGSTIIRVTALRDITERKEAEAALRESEARLSLAVEGAKLGLWDWDLTTGKAVWSDRLFEMCGYTSEEFQPCLKFWKRLIHPDDRPRVSENLKAHLRGDSSMYFAEFRVKAKDGQWRWVHARGASSDYGSQAKPVRMTGAVADITDRKEAEEALYVSELEKKAILDAIGELVVYKDLEGRVLWANRAAAESMAKTPEQLKGRHCFQVWRGRNAPCPECPVDKALKTGEPHTGETRAPDGSWWLLKGYPVKDADGRILGVVEVGMDVTERKRAAEIMLRQEKLSAVADLASGVAHNFNNLLQIVLGNASVALMRLQSGNLKDMGANLEHIIETSRFGAETVRRLNSFARFPDVGHDAETEPVDLSNIMRQVKEMTSTWWRSASDRKGLTIEFNMELGDDCLVMGRKNELFEVAVNLIKNAVEALTSGGLISVRTFRQGDSVHLEVRDTGVGIRAENMGRLFTPFFTTKFEAGTGFGLATSKSIVDRHLGRIEVESAHGSGTTFTVTLPVADKSPAQPSISRDRDVPPCRPLRILVVDDIESIAELLAAGMESFGHTVLTARSGDEGLRILHEAEVDLVICDLGMPGMSGGEVAVRLHTRRVSLGAPKIPFVLLTGWTVEGADALGEAQGVIDRVVQKPVDLMELLAVAEGFFTDKNVDMI